MINIYIDQSVLNHVVGKPGQDWRTTNWGSVLDKAITAGVAIVVPSPSLVIETAVCVDFDGASQLVMNDKLLKRQQLARTLLELCQARTMLPSMQMTAANELVSHMDASCPGMVRTRRFLDQTMNTERSTYLGFLGLMAAYPQAGYGGGLDDIIRAKLITRLIHSRDALAPDSWVSRIIEGAAKEMVKGLEVWEPFDKLSLADMRAEIDANLSKTKKMSATAARRLESNKRMIASVYAVNETERALGQAFRSEYEMQMTFDLGALRSQWSKTHLFGKNTPMPANIAAADDRALLVQWALMVDALKLVTRVAASTVLWAGRTVMHVMLSELEECFKKREVPTEGLTIDADHLCSLLNVQIFATTDGKLAKYGNAVSSMMAKDSKGGWAPVVANTPELLDRAIGRAAKTIKRT